MAPNMIARCPGPRCLTMTPGGRLCFFCSRTPFVEKPTKTCLRCGFGLTLDWFSLGGRCRLCDSCRYEGKMTAVERREALRLARAEYRQRNLDKLRAKDRLYWHQKKARIVDNSIDRVA
jgi:hypothetical protein